jgi:hypothetical protein
MQVKEWFIPCDCRCSVINIEHDDDPEVNQTFMSIYSYGWEKHNSIFSGLKWKFRYIWRILKDGHPYNDSVIIDSISRDLMIDALIQGRKSEGTISTATTFEIKEGKKALNND